MSAQVNSNFDIDDNRSYQSTQRGYLNSDIKVEILSKFEIDFDIRTEGNLPNIFNFSNAESNLVNGGKNKKRPKRFQSVSHNSIIRDRRVSSMLTKNKRTSEKSP